MAERHALRDDGSEVEGSEGRYSAEGGYCDDLQWIDESSSIDDIPMFTRNMCMTVNRAAFLHF